MADYIYKTVIWHDTTDVIGIPASNDADHTDFHDNYEDDVIDVSDVVIQTTSFGIEKSYADFKALITDPLGWEDVRMVSNDKSHELYLVTNEIQ